jgi:hypothetical protein
MTSKADIPFRNLIGDKYWEQNIVHNYASVTYDVTLAMATTKDTQRWLAREVDGKSKLEDLNSLDNKDIFQEQTIILAQTASTITQVTRLEIEGYTSPNQRSNLTYSTKMRMDVVQPQGQSMVRNIYKAAGILGIENHYSHPYFLQVYLKGRKKDGSEIVQEIPGTRRCYAIYISNITYRVDIGGTTYNIEAIRTGNMALADDHQLVGDIEMYDLNTFQDFMTKFTEGLKAQEKHYLGQSKLILDQYEIKVDGPAVEGNVEAYNIDKVSLDAFLESTIINDSDVDNIASDQPDGKSGVRAEIDKNTPITAVLEKFISRNSWIRSQATAVRDDLSRAFKDSKFNEANLNKMLVTLSTHSQILQYDPLRRDYAKKFTYIINLTNYTTVMAAVRDELTHNSKYTKDRISHMLSARRLLKRYDYFNTGVNIDVINFDLQYNFQYVYGLDTVVGLFNKYGQEFYSKFSSDKSNKSVIDKAQAASYTNAWKGYNADGKIDAVEELAIAKARYEILKKAREAYIASGFEPDTNTLNAYNQLVDDYNKNLQNWKESAPNESFDKAQNLKEEDVKLRKIDTSADGSPVGKNSRLGKVSLAEKITDKQYTDGVEANQGQGSMIPVQFYERYFKPESEGTIGVGANSDFHTILKNAKVGSNEMVNATIDIVGDPYWLDYTPAKSNFNSVKVANYRTEKVILFSSLGPGEVDPETGFVPMGDARADEFLTALYRVWKIDHVFDNGQFTQKLHVIRDTVTDLSLLTDVVADKNVSDADANDGFKNEKKPIKEEAKEINSDKKEDVIGKDIEKGVIDSYSNDAVKSALEVNKNKGKLTIDGKEVSKETFNKHYDKLQPKAAQWNADKTRIIGGL